MPRDGGKKVLQNPGLFPSLLHIYHFFSLTAEHTRAHRCSSPSHKGASYAGKRILWLLIRGSSFEIDYSLKFDVKLVVLVCTVFQSSKFSMYLVRWCGTGNSAACEERGVLFCLSDLTPSLYNALDLSRRNSQFSFSFPIFGFLRVTRGKSRTVKLCRV